MYKFVTIEELKKAINPQLPLGFDTETIGLYGKIRLAQFYQLGWEKALILDRPNPVELFLFLSEIQGIELVGHLLSYDVSTIQRQTGARYIPTNFSDTLLLTRLAYPQLESYALDDLMKPILGFDPYEKHNISKSAMHKADWKPHILPEKQLIYAAIDVIYDMEIFDKVKDFKDDLNYKLDMKALSRALDFQCNGFPVLTHEVENQLVKNMKELEELSIPINYNSWQQVRPYLNTDSSDALTIATLALQGNERAADILKAKRLSKQNSFLNKFITDDERIYGIFAPVARSGRFTCKDQNLQQLPRKLKHVFGVTEDSGKCLLYADYPQLELRTIAAITQEYVLIELFKNNQDPHDYVARKIFGENFTKDDRQVIKTYNFNLLYCGGANMIQSILIKDANVLRNIELIKRDIKQWKRTWSAIGNWQEQTIRSHKRRSLKQTPFGRKYMGKLLTDHANIENQGFGADVAKLAMHYMYDDLVANDAKMCNFIHDAYIVEMEYDQERTRKVAKIMRDAMKEAWFEACKMVEVHDIPMPAKVFCGHNWGTIEKDYIFKVE